MDDSSSARKRILARRARFVAAALVGIAPACASRQPRPAPIADLQIEAGTSSSGEPTTPQPPSDAGVAPASPLLADDDGDGIPNHLDKCPNTPAMSPDPASDGCPRPCLMILQERPQIRQQIHFVSGAAKVTPEANPILDAIADVLRGHPELFVEVAGHAAQNEPANLARPRAEAVVAELVSRGVPKARLRAAAYGRDLPKVQQQNPEAWAKNRRVDFEVFEDSFPDAGVR